MQPLWWIMRDIVFDEHYVNYGYAFAFKDTPKSYALSDAFWVLGALSPRLRPCSKHRAREDEPAVPRLSCT